MDCPTIPELGYGGFGQWLRDRIKGQRLPIMGSLELTMRCNLRCVHCYVGDSRHDGSYGQELDTAAMKGIIDQVVDAGCLWLLLTGGEPLARPDFMDLYVYAKHKGLLLTVFTNGTPITPAVADKFAEWRPFKIEISLYGRTQETYEQVTGIPGSYARCMRGIDLLMERNLPLRLKTVVLTNNRHELTDMRLFAEELGVPFRFDPLINAGLDQCGTQTCYRLSPKQVAESEASDPKRLEEMHNLVERLGNLTISPDRLYTCGAGKQSFHIDPFGALTPCIIVREPSYDLTTGSFQEGWDALGKMVAQKRTKKNPCEGCELFSLCAQCPGWAQLENGDVETKVEYLCEVAHERARMLGIL